MINRPLFDKYFDQLTASFLKSVSAKNQNSWFEEVEDCEGEPFCLAMRKLKRGDRFPNLNEFWIQYGVNAQELYGQGRVEPGCDNCKDGWLHVIGGVRKTKRSGGKLEQLMLSNLHDVMPEDYEIVFPCKFCRPNSKNAVDGRLAWKFVTGMSPADHRDKKMIPPHIAKAMIQELREKMNKGGVDWDKETAEAWELHRKATEN